jgi:hypothetical protein
MKRSHAAEAALPRATEAPPGRRGWRRCGMLVEPRSKFNRPPGLARSSYSCARSSRAGPSPRSPRAAGGRRLRRRGRRRAARCRRRAALRRVRARRSRPLIRGRRCRGVASAGAGRRSPPRAPARTARRVGPAGRRAGRPGRRRGCRPRRDRSGGAAGCGHRAARAAAEDDDLLPAHDTPPASTSRRSFSVSCGRRASPTGEESRPAGMMWPPASDVRSLPPAFGLAAGCGAANQRAVRT